MDIDGPPSADAETERNSHLGTSAALFKSQDLTGWRMDRPDSTKVWNVEDGALIAPGNGPEWIHDLKFEGFKCNVEFNCGRM